MRHASALGVWLELPGLAADRSKSNRSKIVHFRNPVVLVCAVTVGYGASSGCGAAQLQRPTDIVLSLQDITCQSCGQTAVNTLGQRSGVAKVAFDRKKAEVAVHFDAAVVLPGDLVSDLGRAGLKAKLGAGHGTYKPRTEFEPATDMQWLTKDGSAVDLTAAAVPGKVTVVDFGAEWCGPCREVDRAMKDLLPAAPDVALRKIDVVDWDSPVARQHLGNVSALPYVVVFGKDGKQVAAIAGLDLERLQAVIVQARATQQAASQQQTTIQ
jgi:thiol-disulfide isomerase/thioredoxin